MKKRYSFLAGLLFLSLLIASCNNNSDKPTISPNSAGKQEFIKIMPEPRHGKLNYSYRIAKDYTEQNKLMIIENGFDSIFFRLWYWYDSIIQVTDFKKEKGVWTAEFHTMQQDRIGGVIKVFKIESTKKSPKSGWDFFIDKILSLGIMTLPDFSELSRYSIPTDASFVVVEMATTAKYRIYTYIIPMFSLHIKEAKAMEDIMELIEDEFGVKRFEKF